jgi:molybdate transport system substrate-binding protein
MTTGVKNTLLLTVFMLCACSVSPKEPSLNIAAAGSLTTAFDEIGEAFSEATGVRVTISYASTGHLAQQILNGGPFDLFAAADARHVDALIEEGMLDGDTRTTYAFGRLVLITHPDLRWEVQSLDDLQQTDLDHFAIANPEHAPYGLAAKNALKAAGLWKRLSDRVVYGETVRQAEQLVETGNAQAGLVAASTIQGEALKVFEIPSDLYRPIEHTLAVHMDTPQRAYALLFIEFLESQEGGRLLESFQLFPPKE